MKIPLLISALLAFLALSPRSLAQTIDFETLPGGVTPTDQMSISNQYQALGVVFSLQNGGAAQMARVGTPLTAFFGPGASVTNHDRPATGANVGEWFLTDDGAVDTATQVIVDYLTPVAYASGDMLDIDNLGSAMIPEEWTIRAFDSNNVVIETRVLNALDPEAGNGRAYPWRFGPYASPSISRLTFTPTGAPGVSSGFALDNFNAGGSSTVFQSFCFGDMSGTQCPCQNFSPAGSGRGCLNSLGNAGGLVASGSSSLSNDSMRLNGSGMPNAAVLYIQGDTSINAGVVFGDGLSCVGGTIVKLGTKVNVGGASFYPSTGDASISVRGGVTLPGTRSYQGWYRNADAAFCTSATFNLTNGVTATWAP